MEELQKNRKALLAGDADIAPTHRGSRIRFRESAKAYALPLELAGSFPGVRWKLIETYRRRYLDVY